MQAAASRQKFQEERQAAGDFCHLSTHPRNGDWCGIYKEAVESEAREMMVRPPGLEPG